LNYTRYIAQRYLLSKSGNNAINVIVYIASIGIFFASAAFIIVLSGFSGIRTFNINLIKLTDPELEIAGTKGKSFLFNDQIAKILEENKQIYAYSKSLEEKVFINYNDKQKIAKIKGVDSNYYKIIPLDTAVFMGNWIEPETAQIAVGVSLANELSMGISQGIENSLTLMVPKPGKGMITDPRKAFRSMSFFPVGIYQSSPDHDAIFLYSSLEAAQRLLGYEKNQISGIEIKLKDQRSTENVKNELKNKLKNQFVVKNREEQNPLIFKMLNTENLMTYFILALILILALFNIIGSILMIIIDKKDNIITLRQIGLNTKEIKKIFMTQGLGMTWISGFTGMLFGLMIIFIQLKKPFLLIPQTNMPYPVEFHLSNIFVVALTLGLLGFFSTLIAVRSIKEIAVPIEKSKQS